MAEVVEEVTVPFPPSHVCAFFRTPHAVLEISDPAVGATIEQAPERLDLDSEVSLRLVAFGMPQSVRNRVTDVDFPHRFVEEQIEGPLQSYHHTHRFLEVDGGTQVIDEVQFEKPGGLAGLLMTDEKIADQLADSFAYRNRRLAEALADFRS